MYPFMGLRNCPDTTRALQFLDSQEIQYEFKDLDESPELNGYVADLNGGKRVMPTIQIDNEILINPNEARVERGLPAGPRRATVIDRLQAVYAPTSRSNRTIQRDRHPSEW